MGNSPPEYGIICIVVALTLFMRARFLTCLVCSSIYHMPRLPRWWRCGRLPNVRPYLLLALSGDGRKGDGEAWGEIEGLLQAFDVHHRLHGVELVHLYTYQQQRARTRTTERNSIRAIYESGCKKSRSLLSLLIIPLHQK